MKVLLSILFSLVGLSSFADNPISGNFNVSSNSVETYTVTWSNWGTVYENYANVTWTVPHGTILEQNKHSVTIQWNDLPSWQNLETSIEVYEDLGGDGGLATVNIINFVAGNTTECTGILGTPAIFMNFGAGSNPGPALPPGITTYQHWPPCTYTQGQYSIVNSTTFNCPNGNWLDLTQDHTPNDINGYMMLVDGSENEEEVFRSLATGLIPAFGYEFSAYFVNLADPSTLDQIKPRIKFKLLHPTSGAVIYSSDNFEVEYDPLNPWKKVSFVFELPPNTSSVIVILSNENNAPIGNDFVVDDISFAPCYPPILASFSNTQITTKSYICNNGIVSLFSRWPTAYIPFSSPGFKWQKSIDNGTTWQDIVGANTQNYNQTEPLPGIYQYRMFAYESANPSQFVISNSITYFVQRMVVDAKTINFYNCVATPFQIIPSYRLEFSDPSGPALNYTFNWSPGTNLNSTTIANPTITLPQLPQANYWDFSAPALPPVTYNYTFSVQNTNFSGCIASNIQTIAHYNPRKVVIPTAFTPNNDGSNDLFRPLNLQDYPSGEFWIYNRWGNLVFHSTGPSLLDFSWNGKVGNIPQEIGAYTWQVTIPGCPTYILNGNGTNNPYGTVTLIR